jgi:MFS transporter, AAHS family, 4-hydroxybenzoate transporter
MAASTTPGRIQDSAQDSTLAVPAAVRPAAYVAALCGLIALLDGFDTQAIGPAAKAITTSLHVPMHAFGPVFSASQIGFLVGAIVFGALGDKLGRKRVLIAMTALFGLASVGTALCPSLGWLLTLRLLTGVGLGGATPNFVSLACEFAKPERRASTVTLLWAAVPAGGMAGAFSAALILPALGWKALFLVGGLLPVALVPLLLAALPESREAAAARSAPLASTSVAELFSQGRALRTILLWLASFMTWTTLIVVAFWTPPLLQRIGWSAPAAATVLALNNAGGVVGALVTAAALARIRPTHALTAVLACAGVAIAAIALAVHQPALLTGAAVVAGFCASAAGGVMLALSSSLYPADARSTGVGWALGVGRFGSVIGPTAAGALVAKNWSTPSIYLTFAVLPVLAAVFVIALDLAVRAPASQEQPQ